MELMLIIASLTGLVIGLVVGFILSKMVRRRTGMEQLKEMVNQGHKNLQETNEIFRKLYTAFNEV